MRPGLSVGVVGAGPAGLYVADALTFDDADVRVDVFDRLPTPFGLIRYGVAPDHIRIKSVSRALERVLDRPGVRFHGGVTVGRDIAVSDLRRHYSAVVYATGAPLDRRMAIPGEALDGSLPATRFVAWYNGYPDTEAPVALSEIRQAVVVGVGNVALDVARVLTKSPEALRHTDMPDAVLNALLASRVTDVHVVGRRGPAQARFTPKELHELGELEGVDVLVDPQDLTLDPASELLAVDQRVAENMNVLRDFAARPRTGAPRRIHLRFRLRPVALVGESGVEAVVLERTESSDGAFRPTGRQLRLPAQLVLRSVGYFGRAIPGVPFDDVLGVIPTSEGRVLRDGSTSPGEYASGWVRRGPEGVLGTNRADATEVVRSIMSDAASLLRPPDPDPTTLLASGGDPVVGLDGWRRIDAEEVAQGKEASRPRVKLATREALMQASRAIAQASGPAHLGEPALARGAVPHDIDQ